MRKTHCQINLYDQDVNTVGNGCDAPKILRSSIGDCDVNYSSLTSSASLMSPDFAISTSKIQGLGLFTKRARAKSEKLFVAIQANEIITLIGSKINHCPWSKTTSTSIIPNTYLAVPDTTTGEWWIIAARDIKAGEELTVDYTNTPDFIDKPNPDWKCPKES